MREEIEWGVGYWDRREFYAIDEGLGSQEEAEAWCAARQIQEDRQCAEALFRADAIVEPRRYVVRWRKREVWRAPMELDCPETKEEK